MTTGSLRLRLFLAAVLSITLALSLTGIALLQLFERQTRGRVVAELESDLLQLVGSLEVAQDGTVSVARALANRRYDEPYGGRYWRIDFAEPGKPAPREPLQSRSLWDADLDPVNPIGPEGEALVAATRHLTAGGEGAPVELWMIAGAHEVEVQRPLEQLRDQLVLSLLLMGILLMIGAWLQVNIGLRPLATLRRKLTEVRGGRINRLDGSFPAEVAPLVHELNDVLDMRETSLERARRRAGDLAHGLKTPLTILSAVARDMRSRKLDAQADEIEEQAETMTRHVERALARARLSSGRGHAATGLQPVVEKVVQALSRLPGAEDIEFDVHVLQGATLPIEQGDLTELLGNLLDNGRKWARSRVKLRYAPPVLVIEDDGPGVPDAELSHIAERGKRLDETKQGSGLGLSIVEDIADIYGLHITYGRSELGGLRVETRV